MPNILAELFSQYGPDDYVGIYEEYQTRQKQRSQPLHASVGHLGACGFGSQDIPVGNLTFKIGGTDMKAIFYEEHGAAEVLRVGERPTPEPQDHEVLVEVVATSVNPIDRRLRSGELQEYITRTFPVVPGWDLAGRIVKVGAKVNEWQVGDEVLGLAFTWSINMKLCGILSDRRRGNYSKTGIDRS